MSLICTCISFRDTYGLSPPNPGEFAFKNKAFIQAYSRESYVIVGLHWGQKLSNVNQYSVKKVFVTKRLSLNEIRKHTSLGTHGVFGVLAFVSLFATFAVHAVCDRHKPGK